METIDLAALSLSPQLFTQDVPISQTVAVLVILILSLAAGMGHLYRCLPPLRGRVLGYVGLTLVWQVLFAFIVHRMARLLEIW